MNDAPINEPVEPQPAELSTPHFDDIAVAVAQPVEPIAPRGRRWLASLEKPRTVLAIVFITAMMGITALALTLQVHYTPQADTAATDTKTEEISAPVEPSIVAAPEPPKTAPRRAKGHKGRSPVADQSKPVARRVGVIYFRRSSGQ